MPSLTQNQIAVYMKAEHRQLLKMLAQAAGVTRSEFVRRLLDEAISSLVKGKYGNQKKAN